MTTMTERGYTTTELCAILGIPYGTVAGRVHRGETSFKPSIVTGVGSGTRHVWSHRDMEAFWALREFGLFAATDPNRASGPIHTRQRAAIWRAIHDEHGRYLLMCGSDAWLTDVLPRLSDLPASRVTSILDMAPAAQLQADAAR